MYPIFVSKPQIGTCGLLVVLITPCSFFEYLLWGKTPQPILLEKEKVQQNTKHWESAKTKGDLSTTYLELEDPSSTEVILNLQKGINPSYQLSYKTTVKSVREKKNIMYKIAPPGGKTSLLSPEDPPIPENPNIPCYSEHHLKEKKFD